jgi:hypothetical protein
MATLLREPSSVRSKWTSRNGLWSAPGELLGVAVAGGLRQKVLAELAHLFGVQRIGVKVVPFVRVRFHVIAIEVAIGFADQPSLIGTNAVISWMTLQSAPYITTERKKTEWKSTFLNSSQAIAKPPPGRWARLQAHVEKVQSPSCRPDYFSK